MPITTRIFLSLLFFLPLLQLPAQNLLITYQNPAMMYVCEDQQFSVTVQNNSGAAIANVLVGLTLPTGIEYRAGTVVGAVQFNISNLGAPKFRLSNAMAIGESITFTFTLHATCAATAAINSGAIFKNNIKVDYTGGTQQLTTLAYPVETGLLIIASINPQAITGTTGDVITRTIIIRNTRQGPISSLQFMDQHVKGANFSLMGLTGQSPFPTLYKADIPGSYFTSFGDGDALMEFGEDITLTQKITLTTCESPSTTIPSTVIIGWGCDNMVCQSDSIDASITVLPPTANANLVFTTKYNLPVDLCASIPAVQEMTITNNGPVAATYTNILLVSGDTTRLGIDFNSVEFNNGSGWTPLLPTGGTTQHFSSCNTSYYGTLNVKTPTIEPGATVHIRFNTYFCQQECANGVVFLGAVYNYPKLCPANTFINGSTEFAAEPKDTTFKSTVYFDIGSCMADSTSYQYTWTAKSGRLKESSGYVQFLLDLPWGLYWDPTCVPKPEGKSPVFFNIDTIQNVSTSVRVVYALPFASDSIFGKFCLTNICKDPNLYEPGYNDPLGSGTNNILFPTDTACKPCFLTSHAKTVFTSTTNAPSNCAISACDVFKSILNCGCAGDGGGSGPPSPSDGLGGVVVVDFSSKRLNIGLRDSNDDRKPDSGASPALPSEIRLDRFLPGDTMRSQLRCVVAQGGLTGLKFRLFNESWKSDFGVNDGDEFDLSTATPILTSNDSMRFIGGRIFMNVKATGQQYTCQIPGPVFRADRRYFKIAKPNIRPDEVEDEIISMFDEYQFTFDSLASTGCVPSGFVLNAGDSLTFQADYKLKFNYTPNSANFPPLINFRNSLCSSLNIFAWRSGYCLPPNLLQYSGFKEIIKQPLYSIQPCADAAEIAPFSYSIRIARGNLFSKEVRPLVSILNYAQSVPAGATLIGSKLNFVRLQENTNLFNNQALTFTQNAGFYTPNLGAFLTNQLDEGYAFEISSAFGPVCNFTGDHTATTRLTTRYPNECFKKPIEQTQQFDNPNSYLNGSAQLVLLPTDTVITITSGAVDVGFTLKNTTGVAAPFTWLAIDGDGNLADVQLLFLPSLQAVPFVAGVYQLGAFPALGQGNFQLIAKSKSCKNVKIRFIFGWDCDPVANAQTMSCGHYERIIELRPLNPELELVIGDHPDDIPMCAPSGYFEFEVYNAKKGNAFGVLPSIVLPPGLSIVPNSSQYSFPLNAAYQAFANPTVLPGNIYQWNTDAVIGPTGLDDISESPSSIFKIRFKVVATCGFVSNAQPIYGAESILPCGAASNQLRKPSDPLLLAGLDPNYKAEVKLTPATTTSADCGGEIKLNASVSLDGPPGANDSIYVLLPPGVVYVSNSYQAGANAPAGPPHIEGRLIRLLLPPGLVKNQLLEFSFKVRYEDPAGCDDKFIILQARETTQIFCPTNSSNCNVYVATGEFLLPLDVKNPELDLKNFSPMSQNNQTSFSATLENTGAGTAHDPLVKFYYDQNKNGKIDPSDPLVGTTQPNIDIPGGGSTGISGNLDLTPDKLCNLLAFIPGKENCACTDRVFPLNNNTIVSTSIVRCEVTPVTIGVDAVAGNTYQWISTGLNLSCTNCAQTTFTPGPNVQQGDLVTIVLMEKSGDCTIERRFDIQYGGVLGLTTQQFTICKGESVQLMGTPGGAYQWSGPGITNATAAIQIVTPSITSKYTVVMNFGNCSGTIESTVNVLQSDSLNFGNIVACKENPPEIFDVIRTEPGLYVQNLKKINGCDSVNYIRLDFKTDKTGENLPLCRGSQVTVFGAVVTQAGTYCQDYKS
ncbi:MAG: hypothetical protein WCR52_18745, partial [Bacteroidota bacterium]